MIFGDHSQRRATRWTPRGMYHQLSAAFQKCRTTERPEQHRTKGWAKEQLINDRFANRTRVRAKMRVTEIGKQLRCSMKKASRAGLSQIGLTGFEPATLDPQGATERPSDVLDNVLPGH